MNKIIKIQILINKKIKDLQVYKIFYSNQKTKIVRFIEKSKLNNCDIVEQVIKF